jgi:hypothetical protein
MSQYVNHSVGRQPNTYEHGLLSVSLCPSFGIGSNVLLLLVILFAMTDLNPSLICFRHMESDTSLQGLNIYF